MQTEEEIILLYEVIMTHGSDADFKKLTNSAIFSPSIQFSGGSKEILLRAISKSKRDGNWKATFEICESSLSLTDQTGRPSLLACDLAIWKDFITAASHLKSANLE